MKYLSSVNHGRYQTEIKHIDLKLKCL